MAKLLKLRRGNTSQHGNFTGAEGEVTVDTDKDTLVVHDGQNAGGKPLAKEDMSNVSSASIAGQLGTDSIAVDKIAAGTLPTDVKIADANVSGNLTIESADIVDGTIVDADVNASAAIAGTKISPDFGSQNIVTSGTVDGRDVSQDGGKLDELYGGSNQLKETVSIKDGVTATTQAQSDNSTKLSTTAYVRTAIADLVDSSPAALNTLNELAAALGDDANFSTTVNNNIAAKLPLAGGTITGDVIIASGTTNKNVNIDVDSKIRFDDALKATFGNGDDLQIYHDGSHSYIKDEGTGNLLISSNGGEIALNKGETENMLRAFIDGAVELYYDNSKKLETSSTGVSVTGALVASGDVTAFSDQTLKKDITTINDALSLCGKLRGVSYKWIKDDKPSIGVIAQEIEQHIPEIVSTTQLDGKDVKSVDYGKIVGVLINAVNELKAELDEYKATYEEVTVDEMGTWFENKLETTKLLIKKSS